MSLDKISYTSFLRKLAEIPGCDHFHDTLISQPYDYLSQYQFFQDSLQGLMAVTPEGNIHIYVTPERKFRKFVIENDAFKSSPGVVFSFYSNAGAVKEILGDGLNEKPFHYLKKVPVKQNQEDDLSIRVANEEDQNLVNFWFKSFNEETGASWSIPDLSIERDLNLYLVFDHGEFIGGATNTLNSEARMWIGRHWVRPELRGKGLGSRMLLKIEQEALNQVKSLALLIAGENSWGLKYYRSKGFEEVSVNCFWY